MDELLVLLGSELLGHLRDKLLWHLRDERVGQLRDKLLGHLSHAVLRHFTYKLLGHLRDVRDKLLLVTNFGSHRESPRPPSCAMLPVTNRARGQLRQQMSTRAMACKVKSRARTYR